MMEVVCPYCKSSVGKGSDVIRCLECGTRHHWICWTEHGNHCSVFRCQGNLTKIRFRKKSDTLLLLWCLLNYCIHLALPYFGRFRYAFHLSDAAIVALLEIMILATGSLLIKSRKVSRPARSFGVLLYSSNVLFAMFLLIEFALRGPYGLDALMRL
jgi:hypothetical protein